MAEDTSNSHSHSLDLQELPNSAFLCEKMIFHILADRTLNSSSPKGGCTNPPNGFRPGAQNRTAKG